MKILVVYTNSEFPMRKTVESSLYCFKKFSGATVYYCNIAIRRDLNILYILDYDLAVFMPSVCIPWNGANYKERMERMASTKIRATRKLAFFQDEYSRTDLMCQFVSKLEIDEVWTVAPETEWSKIYSKIPKTTKIFPYLTGYVDPDDEKMIQSINEKRDVLIGYRTGWHSKGMYKLGSWGMLKERVGVEFAKFSDRFNLDIKIGGDFLNGNKWFRFLSRCKYTLGVESGASLLDPSGQISDSIGKHLDKKPEASFVDVKKLFFENEDGNLNLKAISPRIFEAAFCRTGLILVEGYYNGIIEAGRHYIPVRPDFSNVAEVLETLDDDKLWETITENCYRDLIGSNKYTYARFVELVLSKSNNSLPISMADRFIFYINSFFESVSLCLVFVIQFLRRIV